MSLEIPVYYIKSDGNLWDLRSTKLSFHEFHILNNPYAYRDEFATVAQKFGINCDKDQDDSFNDAVMKAREFINKDRSVIESKLESIQNFQGYSGYRYNFSCTKLNFKATIIRTGKTEDITDNKKILYHCIDIYGNIVDIYIPYKEINNKDYWKELADKHKLLCNREFMPIAYSCQKKSIKEIKDIIVDKLEQNQKYCFYSENKYYSIDFPVKDENSLELIKKNCTVELNCDIENLMAPEEDIETLKKNGFAIKNKSGEYKTSYCVIENDGHGYFDYTGIRYFCTAGGVKSFLAKDINEGTVYHFLTFKTTNTKIILM